MRFSSNPHGHNVGGWNPKGHGAYYDLETWRRYRSAVHDPDSTTNIRLGGAMPFFKLDEISSSVIAPGHSTAHGPTITGNELEITDHGQVTLIFLWEREMRLKES